MRVILLAAALTGALLPQAARAEVTTVSDRAFVLEHTVVLDAPRSDVWEVLVVPGQWWASEHTYSGDAANMTIDPRAGGCFCEEVPAGAIGPLAGSIEHMRVIYVAPEVTLRMSGGLGPLQAEPVNGVLTVGIQDLPSGKVQVTWQYAVSGFVTMAPAGIAPLVDVVLGQQVARLAARLGGPVESTE